MLMFFMSKWHEVGVGSFAERRGNLRGWIEIVGAFFERPRTVGDARPYGFYPTSVRDRRGRCLDVPHNKNPPA